MSVVCVAALPNDVITRLAERPYENRTIRGWLRTPGGRVYYDSDRPERGIMAVYPGPAPGQPPIMLFSDGDPDFLEGLAREVPAGERHLWISASEAFWERLESMLDHEEVEERLLLVRDIDEPLPTGIAKRLTAADAEAYSAHRPDAVHILGRQGAPEIYGVIVDGACVSDAWVIPDTATTMSIGNVLTQPAHYRRGYGRMVVSACVNRILDLRRTPLYDVSARNTPSVELAKQLGFRPVASEYGCFGARRA